MWSLGDETKSVSNLYLLDKAEEDAIAAEYVDRNGRVCSYFLSESNTELLELHFIQI
jgi:hypothetical protein